MELLVLTMDGFWNMYEVSAIELDEDSLRYMLIGESGNKMQRWEYTGIARILVNGENTVGLAGQANRWIDYAHAGEDCIEER